MKTRRLLLLLPLSALFLAACESRTLPAIRNSGEYALEQGDTEKAFADFTEYTQRAPGAAYGHIMLGRTYLARQMPAHAREQFELAYTAEPANEDVIEGLCESLYQDHKYDDLFRLLQQRITEHHSSADYALLGRYSRLTGDADGAQAALMTAARIDKGRHIAPQLELADFYESLGKHDEAVRRARMAYYIDSSSERVTKKLAALGVAVTPGLGIMPT